MRIVHVVESLDIGGLEHVVVALASAQAAQGHDVGIVCLWRTGALAPRASAAGIRVACADKRTGVDLPALRRLRGLVLRDRAPDVLHTHNPMAHYYAVAATLGRRIPCIVNTRHGMGAAGSGARLERLYRLSLRRTDHAVSVCAAARDRFVADGVIPAWQASVVPNGTALERFTVRSDAASNRLKSELALPAGAVVFGTVGRLNEAKQQHLLLLALRRLLDRGMPAALVIAGDGPLRGALDQLTGELALSAHVRLLGARDDVPALLAAMDVFVLPSRTEGWSLALVEASAAQLPIIASRVGGNPEIVRDGVTGLLVPSGDVEALAGAMAALGADADRRAAAGRSAREWALREASLATMRDRYAALYAAPRKGAAVALPSGAGQIEAGRHP
jgi:glycosyltransferase involved in cell wall biosynthesis